MPRVDSWKSFGSCGNKTGCCAEINAMTTMERVKRNLHATIAEENLGEFRYYDLWFRW